MGVSKNRGKTPQIIHLFIGFSIIFTIHFGKHPYNSHMDPISNLTIRSFRLLRSTILKRSILSNGSEKQLNDIPWSWEPKGTPPYATPARK